MEQPKGRYDVKRSDLPVTCPPKGAKWDMHPRVFLPVPDGADSVSCPYCGTTYDIVDDAPEGGGG